MKMNFNEFRTIAILLVFIIVCKFVFRKINNQELKNHFCINFFKCLNVKVVYAVTAVVITVDSLLLIGCIRHLYCSEIVILDSCILVVVNI